MLLMPRVLANTLGEDKGQAVGERKKTKQIT